MHPDAKYGQGQMNDIQSEFEKLYVRPMVGKTLIVGSKIYRDKPDRRKLYPDAVGWDMEAGEGVDRVINLEEQLYGTEPPPLQYQLCSGDGLMCQWPFCRCSENPALDIAFAQFTHIECLSVLEHSKAPWRLAANLERLLKPKGTIFIAVPWVQRVHGYPSDYWRFTTDGVKLVFPKIEWVEVCYAELKLRNEKIGYTIDANGYPNLPRSQVFAFGRKSV